MAKMKDDIESAKQAADQFEQSIKDLRDIDRSVRPSREDEIKLSQNQISAQRDIYLKPVRTIPDGQKFDEKYREEYEYYKEYVSFIGEHKEIIGEKIEVWTKKFKGIPAEYWEIPPGKVVWGPRYLAEQVARCTYRRLRTEDATQMSRDGMGTYTGSLVVDSEVARLTATPVNKGKKSVFMGA